MFKFGDIVVLSDKWFHETRSFRGDARFYKRKVVTKVEDDGIVWVVSEGTRTPMMYDYSFLKISG